MSMPFGKAGLGAIMHELAIGESLVETVVDEMGRLDPPRRLVRVRVVAGALRQIVPEYLMFAYEQLSKGTLAEGSALELVRRPVTCTCSACGWRGERADGVFRCEECGSTDVEMTGGTELYLESLEVDDDE